jgi:hypothetical protein
MKLYRVHGMPFDRALDDRGGLGAANRATWWESSGKPSRLTDGTGLCNC